MTRRGSCITLTDALLTVQVTPYQRGYRSGERPHEGRYQNRNRRYHEQGNPEMSEREIIYIEPPDHLCERCGDSKPRLVFDQLSLLLLCEPCLEHMQRSQAWSFLREDETA